MSISGDEIRAARERAHLTQEELADAVGVSLRTVGNWERGESVPRSRMAAIEEALSETLRASRPTTNRSRMLAHLGQLAEQRRGEIGLGRVKFAQEAGIGSDSTVKTFEFGEREPNGATQKRFERALGWRSGVIMDLLDAAEHGTSRPADATMEYLDGWKPVEPVTRAAELDDVELLTEVIRRMESWKSLLAAAPKPAATTPAQIRFEEFGLAANDTPGAKRFKEDREEKFNPES